MDEREHDDGRCCENGYFGQTHDCRKQPADKPNGHDNDGNPIQYSVSNRADTKPLDYEEMAVMAKDTERIAALEKQVAEIEAERNKSKGEK